MFKDRTDAGAQLAKELINYKNTKALLLAIPRGGVPVAQAIAEELTLPISLVLVKKIGHPFNKEYAIGAANLEDFFVIDKTDVPDDYIEKEVKAIRTRLKEMQELFIKKNRNILIEGKNVIIVDDGIATGNTIINAIRLIRKKNPRKIIVAAPVGSEKSVKNIKEIADEVIILKTPANFRAIGEYYTDFKQVNDEEVIDLLKSAKYSQISNYCNNLSLSLGMKYFPLFN